MEKFTNIIILAAIFFSSEIFAAAKNNQTSFNGRYQLVQLSDFRRDQFLLDTQTGQLWSKSCEVPGDDKSECKYSIWIQEDIVGINATLNDVIKRTEIIKNSKNSTAN